MWLMWLCGWCGWCGWCCVCVYACSGTWGNAEHSTASKVYNIQTRPTWPQSESLKRSPVDGDMDEVVGVVKGMMMLMYCSCCSTVVNDTNTTVTQTEQTQTPPYHHTHHLSHLPQVHIIPWCHTSPLTCTDPVFFRPVFLKSTTQNHFLTWPAPSSTVPFVLTVKTDVIKDWGWGVLKWKKSTFVRQT